MPPKTRTMSKESEELLEYIDKKIQELKDSFTKNLKEDLLNDLTKLISDQKNEIDNLKQKIEIQESTISVLQNNANLLKENNDKVENHIDDFEQYSRRQCLRIDGVEFKQKENNDNVLDKVTWFFQEAGVQIPDVAIDRAHRVGQIYKAKDGRSCKSIIVKFNNFRYRTQFYAKRKTLNNSTRVKIDLTKRNYKLFGLKTNFLKNGHLITSSHSNKAMH